MGRLFWKIFISFWLAMVFINLGIVWVMTQSIWSSNNKPFENLLPKMTPHIWAVSTVLEYGGESATKALLRNYSELLPFKIFVIDEQDRELLGRSFPEQFNKTKKLSIDSQNFVSTNQPNIISDQKVITLKGQQYRIIVETAPSHSLFNFIQRQRSGLSFIQIPLNYGPYLLLLRLGMTLLLSGAICFWLAWYLAKPVRQLRQASRKLADGDLDIRISPMIGQRRDEIADLGRDFDHMAERLQLIIFRQKQLIQDISHELRSPLARLQVAMALTRKKVKDSADREFVRIEREINRLENLVAQILTLAKLDENKTDILEEYIDIAELLKNIVNDAEYEAVIRNCHVHLNCKIEPILNANGELLLRALENIIRNAVKYTADSTSVNVVMQKSGKYKGWIEISVYDQGHGVLEEKIPNLFEPFVRISESRNRDSGGYGLGLTIAKRSIQILGGYVLAYNCDGAGLCIEISLPLQRQ